MRDPGMSILLPMFLAATVLASQPVFASDVRIETRVDPRIRVTVAAIYDSLDREGITGEPLVQYALEGTEKRGQPEVILAGVRRWAKDLRRSHRILGPNATADEVNSGAKALRAGLSEKQLERVREAKRNQRFASLVQ
jgi:hypothetical protein